MAKREKRAQLFGKLGLISSVLAAVGVLANLYLIVPRWTFSENIIVMGSTRSAISVLTIFLTIVLGILGFLGGLEGATSEESKVKTFGWIAFWVGVIATMAAVVLGLCFKCYSV